MPAFPKASSILMSHSDMDLNIATSVSTWARYQLQQKQTGICYQAYGVTLERRW